MSRFDLALECLAAYSHDNSADYVRDLKESHDALLACLCSLSKEKSVQLRLDDLDPGCDWSIRLSQAAISNAEKLK